MSSSISPSPHSSFHDGNKATVSSPTQATSTISPKKSPQSEQNQSTNDDSEKRVNIKHEYDENSTIENQNQLSENALNEQLNESLREIQATNSNQRIEADKDGVVQQQPIGVRTLLSQSELIEHENNKATNHSHLPMNPNPFDCDKSPESSLLCLEHIPIPLIYKHLWNICLSLATPTDIYITQNRATAFLQFENRSDAEKVGRYFHNSILIGGFPKQGRLQNPVPSRITARICAIDELQRVRLSATAERPGWVIVENGQFLLKKNDDWTKNDHSEAFTTTNNRNVNNNSNDGGPKQITTSRRRNEAIQAVEDPTSRRVYNTMQHFNHTTHQPPIFWQTAPISAPHLPDPNSAGADFAYYQQYTTYPPSIISAPMVPIDPYYQPVATITAPPAPIYDTYYSTTTVYPPPPGPAAYAAVPPPQPTHYYPSTYAPPPPPAQVSTIPQHHTQPPPPPPVQGGYRQPRSAYRHDAQVQPPPAPYNDPYQAQQPRHGHNQHGYYPPRQPQQQQQHQQQHRYNNNNTGGYQRDRDRHYKQ